MLVPAVAVGAVKVAWVRRALRSVDIAALEHVVLHVVGLVPDAAEHALEIIAAH